MENVQEYEITAELIRNPYSCFDGYSIATFSSTIADNIQGEVKAIELYVNDSEVESEKFNSIAEKYGLSEMSTVSYSEGVRVTNEQMDMVYNAYNSQYNE